jgi:hypothetical protein
MTSDDYPAVIRWATDPDGGGLYTDRRDKLLAHDPACASLDRAWMPRRGGVVCPDDLDICDNCQVWFFADGIGLHEINGHDLLLCRCCAKKAGVE